MPSTPLVKQMKEVTKERILKALDKASDYINQRPESHVIKTMSSIGFRAMFGSSNPITDKDLLELAYQGFSQPEKISKRLARFGLQKEMTSYEAIHEAWIAIWEDSIKTHWKRQEKIHAIQIKNQVSSLEVDTVKIGEKTISYLWPHHSLEILDSDFNLMKNERIKTVRSYLSVVRKYNLVPWLWNKEIEEWEQISRRKVLFLATTKLWAHCWSDVYYIDQQELNSKGHTTLKRELTSLNDSVHWELHLSLGSDVCIDSDKESIWICANLGDESPSL